MRHEPRQVLEVSPEAVQLRHRTVDDDAFLDDDAGGTAERLARVFAGAGGVHADRVVDVAVSGEAAAEEQRAESGHRQARCVSARETEGRQARASRHREPALRFTDVPALPDLLLAHVFGKLQLQRIHFV